ncbi:MAG: glutathione S-transferase [Alphaproteobacteria bacterium]
MLRILGRTPSINVRKVLWTCDEIDIPYTQEDWGTGSRSTKEPEFLKLNPSALIPVIVDGDFVLRESNTITRYLINKQGRSDLLPIEAAARAKVELWMDWQATDLNFAWVYAFLALVRKNPAYTRQEDIDASIRKWTDMMVLLDGQLQKTGAYVVGDKFTAADIPIGLSVARWRRAPIPHPTLAAVDRYFDLLLKRPAFLPYDQD